MFRAITSEPDVFIGAISTVAEIIDEGIFSLTKEGIKLLAADRALVAVVELNISKGAFETYEIEKEEKIGLNITNFLSIIKRGSKAEKLELLLEENKLKVIIHDGSKRRFTVPLLDITQEEVPPISQLEYKVHAVLKPEVIKSSIEDASVIADAVTFAVEGDSFKVIAEGDISQSELEVKSEEEGLISLKKSENAKAKYPLEYLKKMIKAAGIADVVDVHFAQDYPLRLEFKYADKYRLAFVLAPRVAEE